MSELRTAGHEVAGDRPDGRRVDIVDRAGVARLVEATGPELVIHLAAVSFGPEAQADPTQAFRVNVAGTATLVEVLVRRPTPPALLVVSSSEVYGSPAEEDLPLRESAPTLPDRVYGLSKLAAESVALARAAALGVPAVVARPFNHTGPGQAPQFAVPAFAARIVEARRNGRREIAVGNLDVLRDIGDVRDTVRAYRLLGEAIVEGRAERGGVFNVATGDAVRVGDVVDRLADAAGHPVTARVDPALVRSDDPPCILGDASELRALTGWTPEIPLDRTLAEVLAAAEIAAETAAG
jgi:GDP-4-dehydro-6-deoxy-D-mannose reductase